MNDKQIVATLKKVAEAKRTAYLVESVKAKMIANKIKKTPAFKMIKEQYESGLGPSMDIGPSTAPSTRRIAGGRATAAPSVPGEYPEPGFLAAELGRSDVEGNSEIARFIGLEDAATGPATYQELLNNYREALEAAEGGARGAMSVEELIANFLMPGRSEDEMRQLRRAAARMLRSARR